MGWILILVVAVLAFGSGASEDGPFTPPLVPGAVIEPQNHANPGFQPCSDSTDGVKGRIRAVPVQPQEPC